METEKAKSSHFDRTRGLKNQIFPTQTNAHQKASESTKTTTTQQEQHGDYNAPEIP